jgi:hypothetical protein
MNILSMMQFSAVGSTSNNKAYIIADHSVDSYSLLKSVSYKRFKEQRQPNNQTVKQTYIYK